MATDSWTRRLTDRPNILAKVDEIVKKELSEGNIPEGSRLVGIGLIDNDGIKIIATAELLKDTTNKSLKLRAIFEHDWDGNDTIAGKVIFAVK